MNLNDVQSIDFVKLDIDKYVNWLKNEYKLISRVSALPLIESIRNDYLKNKFLANSHYIRTRGRKLPKKIERLYSNKIDHFQNQINEFEGIPLKLVFFDCIEPSNPNQEKKYLFFTSKELENINISLQYFNFWLENLTNTLKPDFIRELETDFKKSPLPKETYYCQKAKKIKDMGFEYLPHILEGEFIYNLNELEKCTNFFMEVSRIWEVSYLEKQILKLQSPLKKPKKVYTLNPNFEHLRGQIEIIFEYSKPLFNASLSQWQNLFSDNIQPFENPIELKSEITLMDLRLFLDKLNQHGLIKNGRFNSLLQKINAFSFNGSTVQANQYADARKNEMYPYTKNAPKIDEIFEALKLN